MDWIKLKTTVGVICAAVGGTLSYELGGWDTLLKVLVMMVVLDYCSGLIAAFIEKKLHSEVGFKGVAKKMLIFIMVAVAFQLDMLLGTEIMRNAVIAFYCGIEGLSVLKNAGRAGLPIPDVLARALEELRENKEMKTSGKHM